MIEIENLTFLYPEGGFRLHVPSLRVEPGQRVAIVGPSGSGKTTLLNLLAGILLPRDGLLRIAGCELAGQSDAVRRRFRIREIGLVFQEFELLEYLTVRENILLPYRLNSALRLDGPARSLAESLAAALGIAAHLDRYPGRLSQGECQRVAVARALVTRPRLILADEPTGSLDRRTALALVDVLFERTRELNASLVMVTHDRALLDRFEAVIDVEPWRVTGDPP
jgi:putative ABC transport system ATP-binding protein